MKWASFLVFFFLIQVGLAQTAFWEQMGGPLGGRAQSIVVDRNNQVYAGVTLLDVGGVYHSSNQGKEWTLTANNLPLSANVTSLTVNSKGHIFGVNQSNGTGIIRSTDGGTSWTLVKNGLTLPFVQVLAINSTDHVFAGTSSGGVLRSTDNGDTWSEINNGLSGLNVYGLAFNSQGHVFAGTFDGGMFRSTNSGQNWIPISDSIPSASISHIAVDSHNRIFASTFDRRIFRSTDNGESWVLVNKDFPTSYISALVISPNEHVFVATEYNGVIRSIDNGETWTPVNSGFPHRTALSLAADSAGRLFVGSFGGGVFASLDNGDTWSQANKGLIPIDLQLVRLNRHGHIYVAGTFETGMFRSTDGGENWSVIDEGLASLKIEAFAISPYGPIFLVSSGSPYRSINGGDNWIPLQISKPYHKTIDFTIAENGDVLAQVSEGISPPLTSLHRSTDNGLTWTRILYYYTYKGSVLTTQKGHYFVGTDSTIYRSTDSGITWGSFQLETNFERITALAVNSRGYLFATTYDEVRSGRTFQSKDDGITWEPKAQGPAMNSLVLNSQDHIFALNLLRAKRIFRSTDDGESWNPFATELSALDYYSSLAIDTVGRLFASTLRGLVRTTLSTTPIRDDFVQPPTVFQLSQNYPNPFNSFTTISFVIPTSSLVILKIFDALGREISTLLAADLLPGTYVQNWNAATSTSGVYFYRLQAGSLIETKKLILLR